MMTLANGIRVSAVSSPAVLATFGNMILNEFMKLEFRVKERKPIVNLGNGYWKIGSYWCTEAVKDRYLRYVNNQTCIQQKHQTSLRTT